MTHIYGDQGYADAADREDRRQDERARQYVQELNQDMEMMAADRESNLSELDAEYAEASV